MREISLYLMGSGLLLSAAIALLKQALISKLLPILWVVLGAIAFAAVAFLVWFLWFRSSRNPIYPVLTMAGFMFCIVIGALA